MKVCKVIVRYYFLCIFYNEAEEYLRRTNLYCVQLVLISHVGILLEINCKPYKNETLIMKYHNWDTCYDGVPTPLRERVTLK